MKEKIIGGSLGIFLRGILTWYREYRDQNRRPPQVDPPNFVGVMALMDLEICCNLACHRNSSETTEQNLTKTWYVCSNTICSSAYYQEIFDPPNFVGVMALMDLEICCNLACHRNSSETTETEFNETWYVCSTPYVVVHITRKF